MRDGLLRLLGVAIFVVGAFFILDSAKFSGFVILSDIGGGFGSLIGLILAIAGVFLVMRKMN